MRVIRTPAVVWLKLETWEAEALAAIAGTFLVSPGSNYHPAKDTILAWSIERELDGPRVTRRD